MSKEKLILKALESGNGIVRLAPTWVPSSSLYPGRRLKLAPQDLYVLGVDRGGTDERWLSSTTRADNPGAPEDEGLSYIVIQEGSKIEKILLKEAIEAFGEVFMGKEMMKSTVNGQFTLNSSIIHAPYRYIFTNVKNTPVMLISQVNLKPQPLEMRMWFEPVGFGLRRHM